MKNLILLLVFTAICSVICARAQNDTSLNQPDKSPDTFEWIRIGNSKTIKVPAADGFVHLIQNGGPALRRFRLGVTRDVDILSVYLSSDDWKRANSLPEADLMFYAQFSTQASSENVDVSAWEFYSFSSGIIKNLEQIFDPKGKVMANAQQDLHARVTQNTSTEISTELSPPKRLGLVIRNTDMFSILMSQRLRVNDKTATYLITGSSVYVKDRILNLNVYRRYNSDADIPAIGEFTKKWLAAIVAANK